MFLDDLLRKRSQNKMSTEEKGPVGVIGLGNMGSAMAANLVNAGFKVIGADISPEAHAASAKAGVTIVSRVSSAREVAEACRRIILSLPSESALYEVCAELAASCAPGTIILETGTLPLAAKQKMLRLLAEKNVTLLDCPLSGTGAQAKNRDLAVYASGDSKAIQQVRPVIDAFARACYDLGEFGNGIKTKLVANLLVSVHNVVAAEAILFGVRSGLDPVNLVKVLGDGAGTSRMLQIRGPMMANRTWVEETTASVTILQKDINLITEALRSAECPAPAFSACTPIYIAAIATGHAEHDPASVYEVIERMAQAAGAKKG
jgi:3-hydroxyisobutyrate dehydrogenase-like beta-hydroxyacid dehydrogenase